MSRAILGRCVLVLAICFLSASPILAAEGQPAQRSVEDIEKIVRDFLYENPEVIFESVERFRAKEREKEAERARLTISERRKDLFEDPSSPVMGDPEGDVTVVEFFDYRCPHCKRFAPNLAKLMEQDPKVRIVLKELPILGPQSVAASRAALAARMQDQDLYWPFHEALMGSKGALKDEEIMKIASSVGLDADRLAKDMKDPAIEKSIEKNRELAQALRISGTPAIVVAGELIPGAIPLEVLKDKITKARAKDS